MFYILLGVIWFRYHRELCDLDHLILSDLDITGNCVIQISLITIWFRYHLVLSDSDIIRYSESVINGYYKMDSLRSNVLITTEYLWHQFIWRGGESLSLKLDWFFEFCLQKQFHCLSTFIRVREIFGGSLKPRRHECFTPRTRIDVSGI